MQVNVRHRQRGRPLKTWNKLVTETHLDLKITNGVLGKTAFHGVIIHVADLDNAGKSYDDDEDDDDYNFS